MKKVLALILCLVVCLSFVACGDEEGTSGTSSVSPTEKTVGSISVEILSAKVVKDTQNNDAVIVEYKFKNDTQKDLGFKFATKVVIKQGDQILKNAVVTPSDTFDSGTATKYIKPGEETIAQAAYSLVDTTTPLDVSVTPIHGEDKTEITKQLPLTAE